MPGPRPESEASLLSALGDALVAEPDEVTALRQVKKCAAIARSSRLARRSRGTRWIAVASSLSLLFGTGGVAIAGNLPAPIQAIVADVGLVLPMPIPVPSPSPDRYVADTADDSDLAPKGIERDEAGMAELPESEGTTPLSSANTAETPVESTDGSTFAAEEETEDSESAEWNDRRESDGERTGRDERSREHGDRSDREWGDRDSDRGREESDRDDHEWGDRDSDRRWDRDRRRDEERESDDRWEADRHEVDEPNGANNHQGDYEEEQDNEHQEDHESTDNWDVRHD